MLRTWFVGVALATAHAQPPCCIGELYRSEGWTIPGLSGAVVTARSGAQEGDEIVVETLKPRNTHDSILIISCVSETPGRIGIRDQPVDVEKLFRYSIRGRVFAYLIHAGHRSIDGKKRVALGSAEILMYYDLEGDGQFRVREYASKIPYKLRVPEWAKGNNRRQ